jgi:hypothetical protein
MLQTLFGTRLPTVIGGSYAFLVPVMSVISDHSLIQIADNHTVSVQSLLTNLYIICHLSATTHMISLIAEVQNDHESHTGCPDNIILHSDNTWLQPIVGGMLQVQMSHAFNCCIMSTNVQTLACHCHKTIIFSSLMYGHVAIKLTTGLVTWCCNFHTRCICNSHCFFTCVDNKVI